MGKLIAALLMAVIGTSAWAQLPRPTAEIRRFQLDALTLRNATFLFELAVRNPYPVQLAFSGMTLDFSVEGNRVFTAQSQGGFSVPARQERSNVFSVTLEYDAIMRLVKDYAARDWLSTVIDGTLVLPLPRLPGLPRDLRFTYRFEQKIPALKPRVAITRFSVQPPSAAQVAQALASAGKRADPARARSVFADLLAGRRPVEPVIDPAELDLPLSVAFTLEIHNEARGVLDFLELGYELAVNGETLVAGESSSVVREGARTLVTVTSTFSSRKLSRGVRAVFSDRTGSFSIKGNASLKLPDEIRKDPVPLAFHESGTFALD
ncbi:MAG TPA: LEA type 2 family protein [Magnetospirillaceae bacterium]|nr:LEA type 2 family protein [Magnetospirillaceae bacterium]